MEHKEGKERAMGDGRKSSWLTGGQEHGPGAKPVYVGEGGGETRPVQTPLLSLGVG